MLDDRQRHVRKRLQDPLSRWFVGPLLLVLWLQTGEAGLLGLKRPSQDKLHDRSPTDTKSQQVREALHWLVTLDKQWCAMEPALEALAEAFHTVGVARAQDRLLQRP